MNRIVIVEDKIARAVELADQFEALEKGIEDLHIDRLEICYFNSNSEYAKREIEKETAKNPSLNIRHVDLWNFNEVMDGFLEETAYHTLIIFDYLLEQDVAYPRQRINIRYMINAEEELKQNLWFYTATGDDNYNVLCGLFEKNQILEVEGVNPLRLKLDNNPEFLGSLRNVAMVGA